MRIELAVQLGWRVRHRDWPPFHYAELRHEESGDLRLYVVRPDGAEPLDLPLETLSEDEGWSILETEPASCA